MKFSYTWLRELVPGLKMDVTTLAQQITMKTAECEGVHDPGAFPGASVAARGQRGKLGTRLHH